VRVLSIETPIHGRVLIEDAADGLAVRLVAFHGYGQSADDILSELQRISGASAWQIVAVQGLHRFYTRTDQQVVASWMTRQDRELAIADNIQYVDRVLDRVSVEGGLHSGSPSVKLVFVGFSQGVAMAYRAAVRGRHRAAGIVALAGEIPPELKTGASRSSTSPGARDTSRWPPVLIGVGTSERWYVPEEVDADIAFLQAQGAAHEVVRFEGGHEWTEAFRTRVGTWVEKL
jgi:predicted esterase